MAGCCAARARGGELAILETLWGRGRVLHLLETLGVPLSDYSGVFHGTRVWHGGVDDSHLRGHVLAELVPLHVEAVLAEALLGPVRRLVQACAPVRQSTPVPQSGLCAATHATQQRL